MDEDIEPVSDAQDDGNYAQGEPLQFQRTFAPIESDRYMRHVAFVRRKRRARRRTEDDEA
jgi:hypothetical protein